MPILGLASIATLELRYVILSALVEETVTIPVHANVVPTDQAAGRVPNPFVVSGLVYQRAQASKREASRHLQSGNTQAAVTHVLRARRSVNDAIGMASAPLAAALREESAMLDSLIGEAAGRRVGRASKRLSTDSLLKSAPAAGESLTRRESERGVSSTPYASSRRSSSSSTARAGGPDPSATCCF